MKAYAVFDGGGVKGAAFAGCLRAAEALKIEFLGYGGTSAGSIVAFLAAIGYTPVEMTKIMLDDVDYTSFLDDKGAKLEALKSIKIPTNFRKFKTYFDLGWSIWKHRSSFLKIMTDYGLYHGDYLKTFLHEKAVAKISALANNPDFTFEDLKDFPPLRVIASDLNKKQPVVYSQTQNADTSVLEAIRSSISYPIVFCPVTIGEKYLVDGGLSINLPMHIFEDEKNRNRCPVIAFDLVKAPSTRTEYSFYSYVGDMFSTALESSEYLLHSTIRGIYHVPVEIPENIGTLDFSLKKADKQLLFNVGYTATQEFFKDQVPHWTEAKNPIETLQAQFVPVRWIEPVLHAIAEDIQKNTKAENIRCSIMLPISETKKVVVYSYNMENDPDVDLELALESGCSGRAWTERKPVFADLEIARSKFKDWNITKAQQNKIPANRNSIMSIPIFDVSNASSKSASIDALPLIGTLSVDSTTKLNDTGWIEAENIWTIPNAKQWSDILARILT